MKTFTATFVKLVLFFTTLFLITFLSCKDDPISPEESKPVYATTIGVGGGKVEEGDFTLVVPAGAFDGNYDISVSEVEDDGAFGDNTVITIFKISGLPDETNKSLIIKLKYDGTLSTSTYIVVDTKTKENSIISSDLFIAMDSSGYISSDISATSGSGNSAILKQYKLINDSYDKVVFGITDYLEKESPNFKFYHSASFISDINELITNCENTL